MIELSVTDTHYVMSDVQRYQEDVTTVAVKWSKNLLTRRVNGDPIQHTTPEERRWFRKYYLSQFEEL